MAPDSVSVMNTPPRHPHHGHPATINPSTSFSGDSSVVVASELNDPKFVRQWLWNHHRKQLQVLDKFLIELRHGRLTTSSSSSTGAGSSHKPAAASTSNDTNSNINSTDRLMIAWKTVELLRHIIGATRWKSAAQLLVLLKGLGREFCRACGTTREPVIGNVVRRIMAAVREEAVRSSIAAASVANNEGNDDDPTGGMASTAAAAAAQSGRLSLQSMLWALPQHVRSKPSPFIGYGQQRGDHQRQESIGSVTEAYSSSSAGAAGATTAMTTSSSSIPEVYPPSYYQYRNDLKQSIMEAISEIMNEMDDMYKNINEQAINHIHADEVILTVGRSKTIEEFLKYAKSKGKRNFQVVVCESAPYCGGHEMAKSLADAGIDTLVIHDSAIFAMMARVNKVLVPSHAVLANGGLVAASGTNIAALAAHHNSVPVVCVTGLFKLCPMYPHDGQDTLNDLLSPAAIVDNTKLANPLWKDVELLNPLHDYIKPELVSLYITNVGSFQPSFTYRLLAEYYHVDDWESFE